MNKPKAILSARTHLQHYVGKDPNNLIVLEYSAIGKRFHSHIHRPPGEAELGVNDFLALLYVLPLCDQRGCPYLNLTTTGVEGEVLNGRVQL